MFVGDVIPDEHRQPSVKRNLPHEFGDGCPLVANGGLEFQHISAFLQLQRRTAFYQPKVYLAVDVAGQVRYLAIMDSQRQPLVFQQKTLMAGDQGGHAVLEFV